MQKSKATDWVCSKAVTTCMYTLPPHFWKRQRDTAKRATQSTSALLLFHPCIVFPRQKPWHTVRAAHASLPPRNKYLLTAACSFFFYCVCNSPVIVKVVSVLHQGPLTTGLTHWWVCESVCVCVFASKLKHRMTLFLDLTLILLMAATISIRLLGLGTSRLPTYCNKHTHTHIHKASASGIIPWKTAAQLIFLRHKLRSVYPIPRASTPKAILPSQD